MVRQTSQHMCYTNSHRTNREKQHTTKGLPQGWRTEQQSAVVVLSANIGLDRSLFGF